MTLTPLRAIVSRASLTCLPPLSKHWTIPHMPSCAATTAVTPTPAPTMTTVSLGWTVSFRPQQVRFHNRAHRAARHVEVTTLARTDHPTAGHGRLGCPHN